MNGIESTIGDNVAAIVMAGLFIFYLNKRDDKFQKALDNLANAISELREEINGLKSKK